MDIKDVLLNEQERGEIWLKHQSDVTDDAFVEELNKRACLKLIEWLEDENIIGHKTFTVADITYQKDAPLRRVCYPDCKLCKLTELLGGE